MSLQTFEFQNSQVPFQTMQTSNINFLFKENVHSDWTIMSINSVNKSDLKKVSQLRNSNTNAVDGCIMLALVKLSIIVSDLLQSAFLQ